MKELCVAQMIGFVFERIENIMGKKENACCKLVFYPFLKYFRFLFKKSERQRERERERERDTHTHTHTHTETDMGSDIRAQEYWKIC